MGTSPGVDEMNTWYSQEEKGSTVGLWKLWPKVQEEETGVGYISVGQYLLLYQRKDFSRKQINVNSGSYMHIPI